MIIVLAILAQLLHIGLMLAAAPTLAGCGDWLESRLTGRDGPPLLLPWQDLVRLWRKTPLAQEGVSAVARHAQAAALGTMLAAAALVPSFTIGMALSPLADVLVIVSLLAMARVAAALGALDSGAALPGLAQQRASALAVLGEPALLLAIVALALMGGSLNLDVTIGQQREGLLFPAAASTVALTALLAVAVADTTLPAQHHQGGTELALAMLTLWLRRLVWIDLIGGLFLPIGIGAPEGGTLSWLIGLAAWMVKAAGFTLCLAALQTMLGRIPRHAATDMVGVAALLALLALIMVLSLPGAA